MAVEDTPSIVLTERFAEAVQHASWLHRNQSRKDTTIPYVSHLLGAASFLLEQPGITEDMAIAAVLHDTLEDCAGETSPEDLERRFGPDVARMVVDCSDTEEDPKPPWRHRKDGYIAHLREVEHTDSIQVSLADKLHNARSILSDLQAEGVSVWDRFNAPPVGQRWYYSTLAQVFAERLPGNPQVGVLARTVAELTHDLPHAVDLPDNPARPAWVGTESLTGAAVDLDRVAKVASTQASGLLPTDSGRAWVTGDGRWWVEQVDTGSPTRGLAIFVAPASSGDPAAPPPSPLGTVFP